jgi:hypothetical protein
MSNNSFPLTFDVTFTTGPYLSFTADPDVVGTRVEEVAAEVTSIDNITTTTHGINSVTVVVQYTP